MKIKRKLKRVELCKSLVISALCYYFPHSNIKHKKADYNEFCILTDKFNTSSKLEIIKIDFNLKLQLKDNLNDNNESQSVFKNNIFVFNNYKSNKN